MDIHKNNVPKMITMRHEEKYVCSETQIILLESRLKMFAKKDIHQTGDSYRIRSVYFDTFNDRMLFESMQGVDNRSKYRIRIYDASDKVINLEKKISIGQLKTKYSCRLNRSATENILCGSSWWAENKTAQEFFYLQCSEGIQPKVIVEYDRSAHTSEIGNVRITFDKNICAGPQTSEFFDESILRIPVLPSGLGVLEVKYDGILPGYLAQILNIGSLQRVSFSKYGLCRNIIDNNGRLEEYYEF